MSGGVYGVGSGAGLGVGSEVGVVVGVEVGVGSAVGAGAVVKVDGSTTSGSAVITSVVTVGAEISSSTL